MRIDSVLSLRLRVAKESRLFLSNGCRCIVQSIVLCIKGKLTQFDAIIGHNITRVKFYIQRQKLHTEIEKHQNITHELRRHQTPKTELFVSSSAKEEEKKY